jgi:hypothetical protein
MEQGGALQWQAEVRLLDPMASCASLSHSEHPRQLFANHFHMALGLTAANAVRS